jgi:Protein of unknown function (DUF3631)
VMINPNVHGALESLGAFLASQGATVRYVYLPTDGGKVGVDDYLADGHTVDDLTRLAEPGLRPRPVDTEAKPAMPTAWILAAVEHYLERFVVYPSEERHELCALSLWVGHTWTVDASDVTPYMYVKSAEKGSGKTRVLETLDPIVRRPLRASSISAAAVYQAVEARMPTLMIDEADAVFTAKSESAEALRGILNGGNRRGSPVLRGSQDGELREYQVFSPKILAGIDTGKLPDTIRDRAIVIGLKKKLRTEEVERFYLRDVDEITAQAREQLAIWSDENGEALREYRTDPIPEISERLEEAWEPLLAVAATAGGDWLERARKAAVALAEADLGGEVDHAHLLLAATREAFDGDAMRSKNLAEKINELEDYPFGGWRDGKGIDGRGISNLLRRYEIRSKDIWLPHEGCFKGYERSQFEDAWIRHLDLEGDADDEPSPDPREPRERESGSENGFVERKTALADGESPSARDPREPQSQPQSETPGVSRGLADLADEEPGRARVSTFPGEQPPEIPGQLSLEDGESAPDTPSEWRPPDADAFIARAVEAFPGSVELDGDWVPRPGAGVDITPGQCSDALERVRLWQEHGVHWVHLPAPLPDHPAVDLEAWWAEHGPAIDELTRCKGTKSNGQRCKNRRRAGSPFCGVHDRRDGGGRR